MAGILRYLSIRHFGLARQTGYALLSRLAPKAASTLLFVLLLRSAGPAYAGVYTLGVAYLTAVVLFSSFGLDELIVRDVAQDAGASWYYWSNAMVLRTALGVLGYAILVLVILPLLGYDQDIYRVILIQAIAIIPESVTATNAAIFVATRKMGLMALGAVCTSVAQLLIGGIAIALGSDLRLIAWIVVVTSVLGAVITTLMAYRLVLCLDSMGTRRAHVSLAHCRELFRGALPFFLLIGLVSVDTELDVILLSKLSDVDQVGWYGAARSLILVLSLLAQSLRMVIYPALSRAYAVSCAALRRVYRDAWFYLALVGTPIAVGGLFVSRNLLALAYGETAVAAVWSLNILLGHLLANFLYQAGTRLMVVSERQMQLAQTLVVSAVLNIGISLWLTPTYGAVGAAVARTAASFVYFLTVEIHVNRSVLSGAFPVLRAAAVLAATAVMAGVLFLLPSLHWIVMVAVGAIVYGVVVALLVWGPWRSFGHTPPGEMSS